MVCRSVRRLSLAWKRTLYSLKYSLNTASKKFSIKLGICSIHTLVIAATALDVYGGSHAIQPAGTYQPESNSKTGIMLYLVNFLAVTKFAISAILMRSRSVSLEKRLTLVVFMALPFLLVLLIYSVLTPLVYNQFSPFFMDWWRFGLLWLLRRMSWPSLHIGLLVP